MDLDASVGKQKAAILCQRMTNSPSAEHLSASNPYLCPAFYMMLNSAKKSFVWLWMAALLSATIGLSVQRVYCYCTGKTTVTFFDTEADCKQEKLAAIPTSCCHKKAAPSKSSCCEKPDKQKNGCTKKSSTVIQLHTEFEVGNSDFKKLDTSKFGAFDQQPASLLQPVRAFQKVAPQGFDRPPPSLSGRQICVRHGVFRC